MKFKVNLKNTEPKSDEYEILFDNGKKFIYCEYELGPIPDIFKKLGKVFDISLTKVKGTRAIATYTFSNTYCEYEPVQGKFPVLCQEGLLKALKLKKSEAPLKFYITKAS